MQLSELTDEQLNEHLKSVNSFIKQKIIEHIPSSVKEEIMENFDEAWTEQEDQFMALSREKKIEEFEEAFGEIDMDDVRDLILLEVVALETVSEMMQAYVMESYMADEIQME